MKFENYSSSAVKVGDIQSNKVSIDTENLDFIITILSTGLYSNPIESFVREIVSNAWDSHIEANNTKEPVVLELGLTTEGQHYCKVQDFGVGLSPERFNKIYKNIGSSTKRDTNNQIGGFGIGRFSALSYSNVVKIISRHKGTEYMYLMCKENNSLNIDLLYSKPTEEKNGLSVEIDVKSYDVNDFVKAITSQLSYFDNLVVIENIPGKPYGIEKTFNNFIIKRYKNFYVNTLNSVTDSPTILLGKVNYPLRFSELKKTYSSSVMTYPIALKFDIGDIGVTPNREELLYNRESIEKIEKVLDAALVEIDELFEKENSKDHQNLDDFLKACKNKNSLTLVEDDNNKITINKKNNKKIFKGNEYCSANFYAHYEKLRNIRFSLSTYKLTSNRTIHYINNYTSLSQLFDENKSVTACNVSSLSKYAKSYIRKNFQINSSLISKLSLKKLYKNLEQNLKKHSNYISYNIVYDKNITNILFRYYFDKAKKIPTFDNSTVPKKFIEDQKAAAKLRRKNKNKGANYWSQYISLDLYTKSYHGYYSSIVKENVKLENLKKKYKSLVVYSFKGDKRMEKLVSSIPSVTFVGIAPTKFKLVKDLNNFVNIDDFMDKKYKAIRKLATAIYIKEELPNLEALKNSNILPSISKRLYDVIYDLDNYVKQNSSISAHSSQYNFSARKIYNEVEQEIYDFCKENNYFDEAILSVYRINEKELKNLGVVLLAGKNKHSHEGNTSLINLITDYVLVRKLFRPDISAVKKLRKETIFNIIK